MLRLNVPVNIFFSHGGTEPLLFVYYQYFLGVKCLSQGHNTAEVGFEPPASRSGVSHSTIEPPSSPQSVMSIGTMTITKFQKCTSHQIHEPLGGPLRNVLPFLLCIRGYTENRPSGCLQSVIQNTPIHIAWDWLTVRLTD